MKILISSFLILLISVTIGESQILNRWTPADDGIVIYSNDSRTRTISAINKEKIIALDDDSYYSSSLLKYSNNGGVKWDTVLRGGMATNHYNSLAYPADKYMYAIGDSTRYIKFEETKYNTIYQAMIWSSYDNGKSWNQIMFDTNSNFTYLDMSDSITGVAIKKVISNLLYTAPNNGDTIIWTNDGFKTYEKIVLPIEGATVTNLKCINENTFFINIAKSTEGIAKYVITHDRGETWEDMFSSAGFIAIDFLSENVAFVVQKKTNPASVEIKKTVDGGKTWEILTTPELNLDYCFISAVDENNILLTGPRTILYRSTDGGISWQEEYMPYGISQQIDFRQEYYSAVDFVSLDAAFAIAKGRRLFKMTDGKVLARPILELFDDLVPPEGVQINWNAIEHATSYRFQMAISKSNYFSYSAYDDLLIDTVVESNFVILPDLEYNKCYNTRIKSLGDNNLESEWSLGAIFVCTYLDSTYVGTPRFVKPALNSTIGGPSPQFIWTSIPEATKYELQVNNMPIFTGDILINELTSDTMVVYSGDTPFPNSPIVARVRVNDSEHISNWRYLQFYYDESVGVWDLVENNSMLIYPNPASDFINILINDEAKLSSREVQILDLFGIVVSKTALQDGNNRIDISNLPRGTYFIKVDNKVEKFVKM